MTAPSRQRPAPAGHPTGGIYTTAGAADLTAREARALADEVSAGSADTVALRAFVASFLRRCARNLDACVKELRDPIAHAPCCREAHAAQRRNARPGRRP